MTQENFSQKHIVQFRDGSGYAVFDLSPDDVISPTFDTEEQAQDWLDDFVSMKQIVVLSIPSDSGCYQEIGWTVVDTSTNKILASDLKETYEDARELLNQLEGE